ncbi:MAG: hypothetical protein D6714_09105 [Bacteroidetes bacterium]|nr:MAG: hypothetical protein D6714_09105 [Bacteroidota bacterium]
MASSVPVEGMFLRAFPLKNCLSGREKQAFLFPTKRKQYMSGVRKHSKTPPRKNNRNHFSHKKNLYHIIWE